MSEIIDADRELAAQCAVLAEMREMIRSGCCDDLWVIQEAAKHRTNAVQQIVAWLKPGFPELACAIERGEHMK